MCLCAAAALLACAAGCTAQSAPPVVETPPAQTGEPEAETPSKTVAAPPDTDYAPDESYAQAGDIDSAVAYSSLVVSGVITACSEPFGIQSVAGGGPVSYCDWTLTPDTVYRGQCETDTVTVRVAGSSEGQRFETGDTVLLFLYRPGYGGCFNTEGDYYYIYAANSGIYHMQQTDVGMTLSDWRGRGVNWNNFQEDLEACSVQYPIDEEAARKDYIASIERNHEENPYAPSVEDALTEMEQYATIVPLP